ncbi:Dabb family protein [Porphyromonas miyakawae]|uniref:Dabb family protein n=1 Tax=Porphyromonas miyakawae TaxID=3137470 RepID=A0ABQ0E3D5_9PORP
MIRHIVLFTLGGFSSEAEQQAQVVAIKEALEALPAVIPSLDSLHVGVNCNPQEQPTFCLVAEVADMEALKAYAEHAKHQQIVKEMILPYKQGRQAIDYEF